MSGEHHSPLDQFKVYEVMGLPELAGYNVAITNSTVFMGLAILSATLFLAGGVRQAALVPGRWQSLVELYYEFIGNIVKENIGPKGRAFFPFIFTLFTFILFANLMGMVPGGFTVTSHIIVTFTLAIAIFVGATVVGFVKHGLHFLHFFVPQGCPAILLPLLVAIELMSYLARPFTLALRLAANMMAGHVLLKVVGGFVGPMMTAGGVIMIGSIAPIALLIAFVGFEFLVAVIQAYVFALLVSVYLNDAINMH